MSSLSELREIEQQRIADEHAAIEHARSAELAARRAEEQARIDAEQARIRAEREELLHIEQARVDAEREARLRVEAAEAAERARAQIALEEQRMQEEMALRRAEVLQKRPRWMLAVTGLAVVGAAALAVLAVDQMRTARVAHEVTKEAVKLQTLAQDEARVAAAGLAKVQRELEELDGRVDKAQRDLLAAETIADRKRIAAEIAETNRQKREARERLAAAERAAAYADRIRVIKLGKCTDTALGCMEPSKSK